MDKQLRQILAVNLRRQLETRFPTAPDLLMAAKRNYGWAGSTTHRILKCQTAATVDMLEKIANSLGIPPYTLLIPPKEHK